MQSIKSTLFHQGLTDGINVIAMTNLQHGPRQFYLRLASLQLSWRELRHEFAMPPVTLKLDFRVPRKLLFSAMLTGDS